MKKVIPILMSLILLSGMLISPATAQTIGEEITFKGAQVTIAASETGLYIVRLKEPSLAAYQGGIAGLQATSPEVTGARKLDVNTSASQKYLAFLEAKQADLINRIESRLGRSVEVPFQYLAALNGMAVALSQAEAEVVATLPGVLTVRPDVMREMDTEVGPEHIGAATIWTGETISGLNTEGEGIVIGMIDSGINHAHPSFAAKDEAGYTHTNPYGAGVYKGYCATNSGFCNDKLIAAYNFYTSGESPEDTDGHGSHTASTAGGNRHTATYGGDNVEIQGVAPHANIVAYKVCDPGCPGSASIAAVNSAILKDQVDVLNYSISGSDNPWNDDVDLAFLDATGAGIFVSASAGNDGPGASTVAKTGPWNASVGASNHGRVVANVLRVTGPTTPPELQNIPSIPGDGVVFTDDVNASLKYDANNNDGCEAFTTGYFDDSFALVQRGGCSFAVKVANAYNAGADGVVVYNNQPGSPFLMGTNTPPFAAPCVMIDLAYGTALRQYVLDNPSATIFIAKDPAYITVPSYIDTMADFSSRGPSRFELLKPDYVAPGVNILAAVAADGENTVTYDLYQGTSMSSPHGAGAAALMMALNPTWSVPEIKSALAASADPDVLLDYDLAAETDPFDEGSGLLNLTLASRIGLVLDETIDNYKAADPAKGGDPKTLNQPSMVNYDCKSTCTWTRTVTSVASVDTTYTAAYDVPADMTLTVSPKTFTIAPGADQELTITADVSALPFNEVVFASVWLETDDYLIPSPNPNAEVEGAVEFTDLKLPVVVVPTAEFPILTLDPTEIDTLQAPDTQMTETLSIGNEGGADLVWNLLEAPARAYHLDFGGGNNSGSRPVGPVTDVSPVIEVMGEHASVETVLPENTINADLVLSLDDGSAENGVGIGGNWEFIFLNRFTPEPAVFPLTLNKIQVYFEGGTSNVQLGDKISLVVYENTSGSTNPATGSNLLYQQAATVTTLDAWNEYTLTTPVVLNGPGDVLIGVIALETPGTKYYPAAIDQAASQQRSWVGWWEDSPPPTPPTLPPTDVWALIDVAGVAGNWLIRGLATYVGPCDNPADVQWLTLDTTSGTVIPGGLEEVTVTTNSTGMATGVYSANLCFYSNDPSAALTVVPVTMKVLGDPCITVEPTSLEQTLPVNDSATQTLTLSNSCDSDADFEIVEATTSGKLAAELLFEGFEGGVMPPAGGWETSHRGTTAEEWTIVDKPTYPLFVYEGEYAAWVNYDEANSSNEWLLTPAIDATTLVDLELSFMALSDTMYPDATMKLWATDAAGVPLTTEPLWDMVRDETWNDGFYYRKVIVDLSAFEGMSEIRLAWQYVGLDGDSFGLDNIRLTGAYNIPWLSEDPLTGSVPANSTLDVTVTFDSTGMAPGDYYGLLKVINLPYNDIDVPVTLHVIGIRDLYLPLIMR